MLLRGAHFILVLCLMSVTLSASSSQAQDATSKAAKEKSNFFKAINLAYLLASGSAPDASYNELQIAGNFINNKFRYGIAPLFRSQSTGSFGGLDLSGRYNSEFTALPLWPVLKGDLYVGGGYRIAPEDHRGSMIDVGLACRLLGLFPFNIGYRSIANPATNSFGQDQQFYIEYARATDS